MRGATLLFSAALASAAALPAIEPTDLDAQVFKYFQRDANGVNGEFVQLGNSNDGGVDIQEVKIRYGPYNIPANNVREPQTASTIGIGREKGGLTNVPTSNIAKPCSDCLVTSIKAGLENADGDDLNVDTGLMLHHMVLMNGGKYRRDATCGKKIISLPQSAVMASGRSTERFFSSGNERTVVNFLAEGRKVGYKVNAADKFSLLADLMNMNEGAKKVWVTVTYEWIALKNAEGFNQVKPIWLDYNNCGTSDVTFPTKLDRFKLTAQPWTSDFGGDLVLGIGHLHDGGTHLDVLVNDKLICNAKMSYGTTPRYVEMSAFRSKLKMNMTMLPYKQKRNGEVHLEERQTGAESDFVADAAPADGATRAPAAPAGDAPAPAREESEMADPPAPAAVGGAPAPAPARQESDMADPPAPAAAGDAPAPARQESDMADPVAPAAAVDAPAPARQESDMPDPAAPASSAPAATGEQPAEEAAPTAAGDAPAPTREQPSEEAAPAPAGAPEPTREQPAGEAPQAAAAGNAPAPTREQPAEEAASASAGDAPAPTREQPSDAAAAPSAGAPEPAREQPAEEAPAPAPAADAPAPTREQPAESPAAPAADAPAPAQEQPTDAAAAPAASTPEPAPAADAPVPAREQPSEAAASPADAPVPAREPPAEAEAPAAPAPEPEAPAAPAPEPEAPAPAPAPPVVALPPPAPVAAYPPLGSLVAEKKQGLFSKLKAKIGSLFSKLKRKKGGRSRLSRRTESSSSDLHADDHHLLAETADDRAEPGMLHISQATQCTNMGTFKKGDEFTVVGFYDMRQHAVMKDDNGKPKNLMTIALLWAEVPLDYQYPTWQRPPLPAIHLEPGH